MPTMPKSWITEWNSLDPPPAPGRHVLIHDETLRDGLQSPSVMQPTLDDKLELLHSMQRIGVNSVDLGMPASSQTIKDHVRRLVAEIASDRLPLSIACAARTTRSDIAAVAEIAQSTGQPVSVMAFVGTSPIRMYVEQWSIMPLLHNVQDAVAFARREGLQVCIVTEDTTRSRPEDAVGLYEAALHAGAERVCICDTVGYATPWGAATIVDRLRRGLVERGFPDVEIDWHGHNDRGLAVANSLAAAYSGASRLHGTALGIGERAGNAQMEQLLVNLCDVGWRTGDLADLPGYCELAGRICGVSIPGSQPFVGADAYRTAAGVHAAAIRKAQRLGDIWLAERVYTGVPASLVGRTQVIEVGPGSGRANIVAWLQSQGFTDDPPMVRRLQRAVAKASRVFTGQELLELVAHRGLA
jgi:isopropylmalate/homocitrate/citramalate synthase